MLICITLEEIRNWISFLFLIVGGIIALRTFITTQNQRRLENSFRLTELINNTLTNEDYLGWHMINIASNESSGARIGHFVEKGNQIPFSKLFSGGEFLAQNSIHKFCELFDLVGYEYLKKTIDIRLIYFEHGQYLKSVQYWISSVDRNSNYFKAHYPYYFKMYERCKSKLSKLPHKTISHSK
jgi:hypothetical protein